MALERPTATIRAAVEVNASQISPAPGLVAVRRGDSETISAGGILLPEEAQALELQGVILGIGRGPLSYVEGAWREEPAGFEVGDRVSYRYAKGSLLKINGEDILVMPRSEILGTLS